MSRPINNHHLAKEKPAIDLSQGANPAAFEDIAIVSDLSEVGEVDMMAFMEEPVKIIVNRGTERHSPTSIPIGVNGEQLSVPVGIPVIIKRKFVEILFRCKSDNLETVIEDISMDGSVEKRNMLQTWSIPRFAVSILEDKSGYRGQQWASNLMAQ